MGGGDRGGSVRVFRGREEVGGVDPVGMAHTGSYPLLYKGILLIAFLNLDYTG